jgi:hypothetical protein
MAVISVVLADICIFNTEFPVDRDREPVQGPDHFRSIFLVHGARLVPDHSLAQLFDELLHFCTGKLGRHHEVVQVIGRTKERLGRGKTKVFGEKDKIDHETVSEFTGHTLRLGHGIRKRFLSDQI